MVKIKHTLILIALLVSYIGVEAQTVSKSGTTAAQFLRMPTGAKAAALGGAVTSYSDDPSAMRWNPSAIAGLEGNQLMVDHSTWIIDIRHTYLGLIIPLSSLDAIGLNITALTMDDMEETTVDSPDGTGRMFGAYSYAAGITYARYLLPSLSLGANIKYVQESIWNSSTQPTIALDVGTTYKTPLEGLVFGVSVTNFGNKLRMHGDDLLIEADPDENSSGNYKAPAFLQTEGYDLPLMLRAGLSYEFYHTDLIRAVTIVEGNSPNDNYQHINIGAEIAFLNDLIALRGGLPELGIPRADRMFHFTLGSGINYGISGGMGLKVDYAYQQHQYLGGINRLSLSVRF